MPVHATRVLRTAGLVTRFSGHKQKSWSSQSRMGRRRGQSCFQHINVHLDIRKCPHAREAACVKMPTNTAAYDEQKSKARRITNRNHELHAGGPFYAHVLSKSSSGRTKAAQRGGQLSAFRQDARRILLTV